MFKNYLSCWASKPLEDITTAMVTKYHGSIIESKKKRTANQVFILLQSLYNYAQIDNEDLKNPVHILSKKKLWAANVRRDTYIKESELSTWYDSVMRLNNHTFRDAMLVFLYTGMRRNEVFKLKWEYIDFNEKVLRVPVTKNKKALILPLNSYLYDILLRRKEYAGVSEWVFAGNGKSGHVTEPKFVLKLIEKDCGIKFIVHDLRRTFLTIGNGMDVSSYSLKQLVNHSMSSDVTAGYIISNVDKLREVSERIGEKIWNLTQG